MRILSVAGIESVEDGRLELFGRTVGGSSDTEGKDTVRGEASEVSDGPDPR